MLLMGKLWKLTISTGPFSIAMSVITRGHVGQTVRQRATSSWRSWTCRCCSCSLLSEEVDHGWKKQLSNNDMCSGSWFREKRVMEDLRFRMISDDYRYGQIIWSPITWSKYYESLPFTSSSWSSSMDETSLPTAARCWGEGAVEDSCSRETHSQYGSMFVCSYVLYRYCW